MADSNTSSKADSHPGLARAEQSFRNGDVHATVRACEEILAEEPAHALALRLIAECEYRQGSVAAALRTMVRAARSLKPYPLEADEYVRVYADLNDLFLAALAGLDLRGAHAQAQAYDTWRARSAAASTARPQQVTVLLTLPPGVAQADFHRSFDSLVAQSLRPAEVIVVARAGQGDAVRGRRSALRGPLAYAPFDVKFMRSANDGVAAGLNAALARARGDWIVVLEAPHAFERDHLAGLVSALADQSAQWGFAGCAAPKAGELTGTLATKVASIRRLHSWLPEFDTVGFGLIEPTFVPVGAGAIAFSRQLVAQLGGFRPLRGFEMWDLCLRALWQAEPLFVPAPTYVHRWTEGEPALAAHHLDPVYAAMFREYYGPACDPVVRPPNPFAPSRAGWGLHFIRKVMHCRHILALAASRVEELAVTVASRTLDVAPARVEPGVNLVGAAFGEFGFAEGLRALARACEAGGLPFVVRDVMAHFPGRRGDRSIAAHVRDELHHRASVLCLSPHDMRTSVPVTRATRAAGGRVAGYWYWELESPPSEWQTAFDHVDEVWCATQFVADAMRKATRKPVHKVPLPVTVTLTGKYARPDFGLPAGPFVFLFTFDLNSSIGRKNPQAVVAAFRSAFTRGRTDVMLVLKTANGEQNVEALHLLEQLVADDSRVVLLDALMRRDETYGLISVCDAYVSLHRAEGLGLGMAEAMYLGKPVIATAYSGNLEFMRDDNSALVDYRLVPVRFRDYFYDDPRFVWADPDVDCAARYLRRMADDPAWRSALATAGQRTMRTEFTNERTARVIQARLMDLGANVAPAA